MAPFSWKQKQDLADTLLKTRLLRRRMLLALVLTLVAMLVVGVWPLASWLGESLIRFAIYWLVCALLTLFMSLLALYDLLSVPREERRDFEEDLKNTLGSEPEDRWETTGDGDRRRR